MLKVTIYYNKEKKDKLVYENVKNIYIYPEPQTYMKTFPETYGVITQAYSHTNRYSYYTQIYKKPYMIYIEEQPIKVMEL